MANYIPDKHPHLLHRRVLCVAPN